MINLNRRRFGIAMAAAPLGGLGFPHLALAQAKPVTIVLTVPAGTSIDALARVISARLTTRLNRTVVVESRAGGGGVVAVNYLNQFPADGSVLMLAPTSVVSLHKAFTTKPAFEAGDLMAITEVAGSPHTITVNRAMGVNTIAEYVEYVRKNPKQGSVGAPSLAGLASLLVFQLRKTQKLDLQFVPYKGGQPLLADLLGNQIPAASSVLADYLPEHRNGRIRILAHASDKRSPLAPDVPTFKESGIQIPEIRSNFGLFAKKGTPDATIQTYAQYVNEALAAPDVIERLAGMGLSPIGGTPQDYQQKIIAEDKYWEPVIAEAGLKIN